MYIHITISGLGLWFVKLPRCEIRIVRKTSYEMVTVSSRDNDRIGVVTFVSDRYTRLFQLRITVTTSALYGSHNTQQSFYSTQKMLLFTIP